MSNYERFECKPSKRAGLFTYNTHRASLHIFVKPRHWVWLCEDDAFLQYFGLGPLFLIARDPQDTFLWSLLEKVFGVRHNDET